MTPIELIQRLGPDARVKKTATGWQARCPAHDDRDPSLSISEGNDGRILIKCHAGCGVDQICEAIGIKKSELFPEKSKLMKKKSPRMAKAFNWKSCAETLRQEDLEYLAEWRGWSLRFCEWLKAQCIIGIYKDNWAFPVHDGRSVIGCHYRVDRGPGKKPDWYFTPGCKAHPLVIGQGPGADGNHYVFESQWDLLTYLEKVSEGEFDLYCQVGCYIATRGASNTKDLRDLIGSPKFGIEIYPHNDESGRKWAKEIVEAFPGIVLERHAPKPFKDLNEWTLAAAKRTAEMGVRWSDRLVLLKSTVHGIREPSALSDLLDAVRAYFRRYIVFQGDSEATFIALWTAHTYVMAAFDYTPYLNITSAEKRSGKTNLLDAISFVCNNPCKVSDITPATMFRIIAKREPTLLLDEADALLTKEREELRAIFNVGYKRGGMVPRCNPVTLEPEEFPVFAPKVIAGIGELPDTITDRSVQIQMIRKVSTDNVERFRDRLVEQDGATIRAAFKSWAAEPALIQQLQDARPEIPAELNDRLIDVCEPLLAIADGAGWGECARRAIVTLSQAVAISERHSTKLLRDIRQVFYEDGAPEQLATIDLAQSLVNLDTDAPWARWWEKPLKDGNTQTIASNVAKILKPFGVKPRVLRLHDGTSARGYRRVDFEESWKRYLE